MRINELTNTEVRSSIEEAITVIGLAGARSIAWHLIDSEAEKVTSDITDKGEKRLAELAYTRKVLDHLNDAYEEELQIAQGGADTVYRAL